MRLNKNHLKDLREAVDFTRSSCQAVAKDACLLGAFGGDAGTGWIEDMGWMVSNFEVWDGKLDIECISPTRTKCAIEVKSITSEDSDCIADVYGSHFRGIPETVSPHQASNLVLLRGLEAADKLRDCEKVRIACLVVSEEIWYRFESLLRQAGASRTPHGFSKSVPSFSARSNEISGSIRRTEGS